MAPARARVLSAYGPASAAGRVLRPSGVSDAGSNRRRPWCGRCGGRMLVARAHDGAVLAGIWYMAAQVTLTEAEVRAFSSLLCRVGARLATYGEQAHQDK